MKFDLIRPCKECPFRTDVIAYLSAYRAREICRAITKEQQTFICHKTTTYDDDGELIQSAFGQHCAGALIFLERRNRPNQMMRIAERIGIYDRTKLDMTAPVYETAAAMANAQPRKTR